MSNEIAIVDLGGQYCHLISRRLHDLGFPSKTFDEHVRPAELVGSPAIILSGGPQSVYSADAPDIDTGVFSLDAPMLGICYGHQLIAKHLGAPVVKGDAEYGLSILSVVDTNTIFGETPSLQSVWMSHSDSVAEVPPGTIRLAQTDRCPVAAFADPRRRLYGVQFHPEVHHTEHGDRLLFNFLTKVAKLRPQSPDDRQIDELKRAIREQVGDESVFFLVSGGVDSTVAFVLCAEALGPERVLGLYVDTGFMRKNETDELRRSLTELGVSDRVRIENQSDLFLKSLRDVNDPETKRRLIGRLFVDVQREALAKHGVGEKGWLLGQGTIYPDTIESGGSGKGQTAVIKTHHNRCQEIVDLLSKGRVVEPLARFYKDQVRLIGEKLGLSSRLTERWPFPGPGLAIRCLCVKSEAELRVTHFDVTGIDSAYEAISVPIQNVGVQGDSRTYRYLLAVSGPLDYERLQTFATRFCNADIEHNRVVALLSQGVDLRAATVKPSTLSAKRIETLREADWIARKHVEDAGLSSTVWQFPVVLIPLSFCGGETIVLRPVVSVDGMTANFAKLPTTVLHRIQHEIEAIDGIDAVALDVTNKPPATIEWE